MSFPELSRAVVQAFAERAQAHERFLMTDLLFEVQARVTSQASMSIASEAAPVEVRQAARLAEPDAIDAEITRRAPSWA